MHCLKNFAFLTTLIVAAICFFMLKTKIGEFADVLLFAGYSIGPLLISAVIAAYSAVFLSRLLITAGSVIYLAWFVWGYYNAFFWNKDQQSADALLTIGLYSLPVMVPVWIGALYFRKSKKPKESPGTE